VGIEANRKSGKFRRTAKLEIQQNWKTRSSTNQDLSQKQQDRNPMKLHCQEFRCPGEQEFRKTTVCPSGTLPPDIPQI